MKKQSGFSLLAMIILILFTLPGFAAELTGEAWSYFLKGNYEKAIEQSSALEGCEPHYIIGLSYIKLEKPMQAREHFKFILETYPDAALKQETILSLADTYFLELDFTASEARYEDFLRNYPSSDMLPLVYLRLGQVKRRLGKWQDAKQALSKVITGFPSSMEKVEAEKELGKEFYYYIQAGSFTRKQNAGRAKTALAKKGFDAYVNTVTQDSKIYYRVCAGKYDKKEDALLAFEKIKGLGYEAKIYP